MKKLAAVVVALALVACAPAPTNTKSTPSTGMPVADATRQSPTDQAKSDQRALCVQASERMTTLIMDGNARNFRLTGDVCATHSTASIECYESATNAGAILACARTDQADPIVVRRSPTRATVEKRTRCAAAELHIHELIASEVRAAQPGHVRACVAANARYAKCQTDAGTAGAWIACKR